MEWPSKQIRLQHTQEISLVFVVGFIMNRKNYHGGVPGAELFCYVYLSRSL